MLENLRRQLVVPEAMGSTCRRYVDVLMSDPRLRHRAQERGIDVPEVSDPVAIALGQYPEVRRYLDLLAEHGVIGGASAVA